MDSDTLLDYAQFQLSPRRSHCELFVYGDGKTEKIASGLVKPFVTHLKVAEEQPTQATQSIKLQVEKPKKSRTWFNKGTLERFVRFVSTPEVLEMVHTVDSEMSQLEGARGIYSQGVEDQLSGSSGESEKPMSMSGDATKKELLRAIDVRLGALKQELTMAFARASAAGFDLNTVSDLIIFADHFGARRLNEACQKFSLLCQRRPHLATQLKHQQCQHHTSKGRERAPIDSDIRSSSDSDMSLDGPEDMLKLSTSTATDMINSDDNPNSSQRSSLQLKMPKSSGDPGLVHKQSIPSRDNTKLNLEASAPSNLPQPAGGSRRLSVQDRINLFESKQKEQSGSMPASVGSANANIGVKAGGRPELRRLSSDVSSSVEKSVLRRWSGASDMSIDLGSGNTKYNKKEEESTVTIPSDSSNISFGVASSVHTDIRNDSNEDKDTATSMVSVEEARPSVQQHNYGYFSRNTDPKEDILLKEKADQGPESKFMQGKHQLIKLKKENTQQSGQALSLSQTSLAVFSDTKLDEQATTQMGSRTISCEPKSVESHFEETSSVAKEDTLKGKKGPSAEKEKRSSNKAKQSQDTLVPSNSSLAVTEVGVMDSKGSLPESQISRVKGENKSNRKTLFNSEVQSRTGKTEILLSKGSHLASQQVALPPKSVEIRSTNSVSSAPELLQCDFQSKGAKETKVRSSSCQKPTSDPNCIMRLQSDRDGSPLSPHSIALPTSGKKTELLNNTYNLVLPSNEPLQNARSVKGNQNINGHLQMKADELEKLFAEHMLRVPGDVPSIRRGKPVDDSTNYAEKRPEEDLSYKPPKLSAETVHCDMEFNRNKLFEIVNNHEYSFVSKFGDLNLPEGPRGKFYEKYMQKRDHKLRERRSRRASNEAKMKAMQDRLEQSAAEMKAKFSGSVERRTEKLRCFGAASMVKTNGQQPVKLSIKEGEEDSEVPAKQLSCDQYQSINETSMNSSLQGPAFRKSSSSRSLSSTPRSVSITSNPTMEPTAIGSGRRRIPSENTLAQSIPNFPDLRKENARPLSGTVKMSTRVQSRSSIRDRGSGDSVAKEEKPHRSQTSRKGSANPAELSDLSSINSDNLMVEQSDQNLHQKGPESKAFLRKGKGIRFGAGTTVLKTRASMVTRNVQEDDFVDAVDNVSNVVTENSIIVSDEITSRLDSDSILSADPVYSDDLESENGEAYTMQDGSFPVAVISSPLISPVDAMQESLGESPGSWNSRIHHSFSYVEETFDVDASINSPIPTSWKSHSLSQMMDSDAAPMRKKWGAAQKPMFLNSTLNQPKKDVAKGFKRLLKFGRKNKGSDSLLPDWISASTNSEGDEDLEDSHDFGTHVSDDKLKSRMGISQHPSPYDGFSDSIFLEEGHSPSTSITAPPANFKLREDHLSGSSLKAPRSFFSLSTFRSKGSESKLR